MIADLYAEAINSPSDIWEHLPTFVELCQQLDAQRVIELGVRYGTSTIAWLYGLGQHDGHLWSVDISDQPGLPAARWTFVQGDDRDPAVLAQLPDLVDIVFIDTSHTFAHTLTELKLYSPRVRPGGRIVLHDTEVEAPDLTDEHDFPVKRAIEQFCTTSGYVWSNRTNNNGLGIIEVPA